MVDVSQVWQCGECMKTYANETTARHCCIDHKVVLNKVKWIKVNIDDNLHFCVDGVIQLKISGKLIDIPMFYVEEYGIDTVSLDFVNQYNQVTANKIRDALSSAEPPSKDEVKELIQKGRITYEN